MTVRSQAALAGVLLLVLCGAAQAKSAACACHLLNKNVHRTIVHRTTGHVSKPARQGYASRTTHKDDRGDAREAQEGAYNMRRDAARRDGRYESQRGESNVTASRETRRDYDYYDAREAREDVYNTRQTYARQDEPYSSQQYGYSYGYGDYRAAADGPPAQLNGRDFAGGVGYGQNGDMGYYQGGYGRFDPYNGNTAGMNGGVVGDGARMSVWHGYNGHNGLSNGY